LALKYEYICEENGRRLVVSHGMNEQASTWGELCEFAGCRCEDTDPNAPVTRIISGGVLALPRRISKEAPKSDYDPVLHGDDSCIPCACGMRSKQECDMS
jgi:hypothetical protein